MVDARLQVRQLGSKLLQLAFAAFQQRSFLIELASQIMDMDFEAALEFRDGGVALFDRAGGTVWKPK